jgi:hypothetical protein
MVKLLKYFCRRSTRSGHWPDLHQGVNQARAALTGPATGKH